MNGTAEEAHPFLSPRHIDALTEAVRALTAQITLQRTDDARYHRETLAALQLINNNTENVAGLLSMLIEKPANGATEGETNE